MTGGRHSREVVVFDDLVQTCRTTTATLLLSMLILIYFLSPDVHLPSVPAIPRECLFVTWQKIALGRTTANSDSPRATRGISSVQLKHCTEKMPHFLAAKGEQVYGKAFAAELIFRSVKNDAKPVLMAF